MIGQNHPVGGPIVISRPTWSIGGRGQKIREDSVDATSLPHG